jgi:hypothetical protein
MKKKPDLPRIHLSDIIAVTALFAMVVGVLGL